MPQGVEVFDSSGNSIFDSSVDTLRIAGVTTFTGNVTNQTQSFTPGTGRDFFYFAVVSGGNSQGYYQVYGGNRPIITVTYNSGTITFTINGIVDSNCYINIFWGDY